MTKTVDIFIPCEDFDVAQSVVEQFLPSTQLRGVFLLTNDESVATKWQKVAVDGRLLSSGTMVNIDTSKSLKSSISINSS